MCSTVLDLFLDFQNVFILRKDSSYVALKVEDYMFIVDMVGRGAMC